MVSRSTGGKGSAQRPAGVSKEEIDDNWDRIFGKKEKQAPTEQAEAATPESTEGTERLSNNAEPDPTLNLTVMTTSVSPTKWDELIKIRELPLAAQPEGEDVPITNAKITTPTSALMYTMPVTDPQKPAFHHGDNLIDQQSGKKYRVLWGPSQVTCVGLHDVPAYAFEDCVSKHILAVAQNTAELSGRFKKIGPIECVIVIERPTEPGTAYGVLCPDYPGFASAGDTAYEAIENAKEGLSAHVGLMREMNMDIPESHFTVEEVLAMPEYQGNQWTAIAIKFL